MSTEHNNQPATPWRDHDAAIDAKALATATEIALMWGQDRSQFVSRIQVAVIDAMRWIKDALQPVATPTTEDSSAVHSATPAAPGIDLREPMRNLYRAYVRLLEAGRDRIIDLGGRCDSVQLMEESDTDLRAAREALDASPKGGDERARFEAWAEWFGVGVTRNFFTDKYNDKLSEDLWCAWQSASQNGPSEKAVDQWHSIETAPKDGTLIDLWNHETAYRSTYMMWGECGDPKEKGNRGWVSAFGSSGFFCPTQYSHWRHAPAPPLVNRKPTSAEVGA